MQALEEDRYVRQTEGYLPTGSVAFIDEIFKANSAILNTLLTILNERLFDNGTERITVPLICLASPFLCPLPSGLCFLHAVSACSKSCALKHRDQSCLQSRTVINGATIKFSECARN